MDEEEFNRALLRSAKEYRHKRDLELARDKALEDAEEAVGRVEIPKGGLPPDRVGAWLCALNESMSAIRAMKKDI